MRTDKRIEKIIEEATVDTYNEWEELAGWDTILTDNISTPQKCKINDEAAILIGISSNDKAVYAKVRFEKLKKNISVPIEHVDLKDKSQAVYIKAYKKGFSDQF